jgi:hypothetical protein
MYIHTVSEVEWGTQILLLCVLDMRRADVEKDDLGHTLILSLYIYSCSCGMYDSWYIMHVP